MENKLITARICNIAVKSVQLLFQHQIVDSFRRFPCKLQCIHLTAVQKMLACQIPNEHQDHSSYTAAGNPLFRKLYIFRYSKIRFGCKLKEIER